jgi:TPR repeat protein
MKRSSYCLLLTGLLGLITLSYPLYGDLTADILDPFAYDGIDSLKNLYKTAIPAMKEGNHVAKVIVEQLQDALGQDRQFNEITFGENSSLYADTEKEWLDKVIAKADKKDPFFMTVLGTIQFNGYVGTPKDTQKGFKLWQQAADMKFGLAKLRVGNCYMAGDVVQRDLQKAAVYYREAGELGVPLGWYNVGCLYNGWQGWSPRDLNKAMECWAKSAPMGHAWSQYNLGFHYCNGDKNFPVNKELGIQWMRAAASNGHPRAKSYLSDYVDKKPDQRTLPAIIEDKNTDVVSTFIAFDKIKESITGPKISVVCFVDAYEIQLDRSKQRMQKPSHMLDIYLTGIRTFKKKQAGGSVANTANADDVKILIVEGRADTRAKVQEFDKQCQLKAYDGTIPVLYVFHLGKPVKTYTYDNNPGPNGKELKSLVESLLSKK